MPTVMISANIPKLQRVSKEITRFIDVGESSFRFMEMHYWYSLAIFNQMDRAPIQIPNPL
jgi:hypothetical protein